MTPQLFGERVLGPIVAEFCFRLWSLASLLEDPDEATLLFCARGGLRLQLAYEHLLAAGGMGAPTRASALMVSRVVAVRPALLAGTEAARKTLKYEFSRRSVADVARALTGIEPQGSEGWTQPFSCREFDKLLRHPDGRELVAVLIEQADLFGEHLRGALRGRGRAILVDTGLFGTTMQLLAGSLTDVNFSCAMIARSNYRAEAADHFSRTFGLSVESDRYVPWRPHTSVLRYWHFIEATLEPDLPSVRLFHREAEGPRCNLEIEAWRSRVPPKPNTAFAGVLAYIDGLPRGPAATISADAAAAWRMLRRALAWPDRELGEALDVGRRGHDFGLAEGSSARPWRGPIAALRGHSLWREGEIARSGSPLRLPLLASIETAHAVRAIRRVICSALS